MPMICTRELTVGQGYIMVGAKCYEPLEQDRVEKKNPAAHWALEQDVTGDGDFRAFEVSRFSTKNEH
eukprot:scaffold22367_cov108-Skeletonema_menzelii.AAC.1